MPMVEVSWGFTSRTSTPRFRAREWIFSKQGPVGEAVLFAAEVSAGAVSSPGLTEVLELFRGDGDPVFLGDGHHLVGDLPEEEFLGSLVGSPVHLLQGEGEVANQVPVTHHRQRQVVGVAVHVYPQDPVGLGVDGRGKPLAPGEVGVDLAVLEPEGHVVGQGGVGPLEQGLQLGVGGPDQGVDVSAVPQVDPEPEGIPLGFQAQVGVALLGGVPPGVEEALPPFLPLPLQGQKGLAGEVFALELFKELPPPKTTLRGSWPSSRAESRMAWAFSMAPSAYRVLRPKRVQRGPSPA
jgi:hypothetical protein